MSLVLPYLRFSHYPSIPLVNRPVFSNIVIVPSVTPTPTVPPPLTFNQLDSLYGPCIRLPVLMYHHIQSETQAKAAHQTGLTVYTPVFRSHLAYLKNQGYSVITADSLLSFFIDHQPLPPKPVLLTFDDGYQDFYTDALPLLKEFNFPSILFVSTGLLNNPGYLSWSEVTEMSSQNRVYIGNHTWSHHSLGGPDTAVNQKEISLADSQILDHGLPHARVMAYPYGSYSAASESYLAQLGYGLSFTTQPGSILCNRLRLRLPRVRAGNVSLSNFGL